VDVTSMGSYDLVPDEDIPPPQQSPDHPKTDAHEVRMAFIHL
jgi:hypothetical protein